MVAGDDRRLEPLAHAICAVMPTLSEALPGVAKRDLDEHHSKTDGSGARRGSPR